MKELGWIAVAGAVGTLSRYGLSGVVQRVCGERLPWGTLAVNGLGCFLFGLIWMMAEEHLIITGRTRLIVLTGFMGAFTTFSTFAFESSAMMRDSQWLSAVANIAGQNVLGLTCILLGFAVGRMI